MTPDAPLAALIFALTVGVIISRPGRITEAIAGLIGATAMVVAGVVAPSEAVTNVGGHWNVRDLVVELHPGRPAVTPVTIAAAVAVALLLGGGS